MKTPPIEDPRLSDFLYQWESFCLDKIANAGFFSTMFNHCGISEKGFIKWMGREKYDSYFSTRNEETQ